MESKHAPKFAEIGQQIADFLRGAELIIHNAKFDVGFLNMEFQRMGLPTLQELDCEITDTLAMARKEFPGQKISLDALCNRFEIDRSKRIFHGALIDCELLAEVYLAMTRKQGSFTDAFEAISETAAVHHTPRPQFLKVLFANLDEMTEHERYLDELGTDCVWRQQITTEKV